MMRFSGIGAGAGPYIAIHEGFQGVRSFLCYTHDDVLISDRYFHPHSPLFGKGTSGPFQDNLPFEEGLSFTKFANGCSPII